MPQAGVTPLCGLNLGAEHRDICSKFIENKYLGADGTFRLDGSTETGCQEYCVIYSKCLH